MSNGRVQSVERSIDILMALADGPKTLAEVTRTTGLSKATTFRLLATLGYENLVVKSAPENRYMLGPGFLRLLQGVTLGVGAITAVARAELAELCENTQETVAVHVRVGAERVCVDELPSPLPLRYTSGLGAAAPLHVGAAGLVLLAFMEPKELDAALHALALLPPRDAPEDMDALRRELDVVRRQGYAMSTGARIIGAAGVTVPIRGPHGFLAGLSVLGPADRLPKARRVEFVPLMQETAKAIERALTETQGDRPTVAGTMR